MSAPQFSTADYRQAFQSLLPRGRAWSTDGDSIQAAVAAGLVGKGYERNNAAAIYLLTDSFPATAAGLLPEWEEALGLPDSCYRTDTPTIQDRQWQVVAKLAYSGGQSAAYFIAYAAQLGYTITITEFTPARAGIARAGMPIYGPAWAFAWQINGDAVTYLPARSGISRAGEPLAIWGNSLLLCKIAKIAPAHTIPLFNLSA